jgi:hypothetical protein
MIGFFSDLQRQSRQQQILQLFQSVLLAALVARVCGWPAWVVAVGGTVAFGLW